MSVIWAIFHCWAPCLSLSNGSWLYRVSVSLRLAPQILFFFFLSSFPVFRLLNLSSQGNWEDISMAVWLYMAVWLHDWLCRCVAVWLCDCMAIRLCDCVAMWLWKAVLSTEVAFEKVGCQRHSHFIRWPKSRKGYRIRKGCVVMVWMRIGSYILMLGSQLVKLFGKN